MPFVRIKPDPDGDEYRLRWHRVPPFSTVWVNGQMAMNVKGVHVLVDGDRPSLVEFELLQFNPISPIVPKVEDDRMHLLGGKEFPAFEALRRSADGELLGRVIVEYSIGGEKFEFHIGPKLSSSHIWQDGAVSPLEKTVTSFEFQSDMRGLSVIKLGFLLDNVPVKITDEQRAAGRVLPSERT